MYTFIYPLARTMLSLYASFGSIPILISLMDCFVSVFYDVDQQLSERNLKMAQQPDENNKNSGNAAMLLSTAAHNRKWERMPSISLIGSVIMLYHYDPFCHLFDVCSGYTRTMRALFSSCVVAEHRSYRRKHRWRRVHPHREEAVACESL